MDLKDKSECPFSYQGKMDYVFPKDVKCIYHLALYCPTCSVFHRHPMVDYPHFKPQTDCVICLEMIKEQNIPFPHLGHPFYLQCGHSYHFKCILELICKSDKATNTDGACAICRQKIESSPIICHNHDHI